MATATFSLASSQAILSKAGANVNRSLSGAIMESAYNQAVGFLNAETRMDWDTYASSLVSSAKFLCEDVVSDLAGMKIIAYDMSGYTSRTEAQTMLDFLRDNSTRGIAILKDFKTKDIKNPTV